MVKPSFVLENKEDFDLSEISLEKQIKDQQIKEQLIRVKEQSFYLEIISIKQIVLEKLLQQSFYLEIISIKQIVLDKLPMDFLFIH